LAVDVADFSGLSLFLEGSCVCALDGVSGVVSVTVLAFALGSAGVGVSSFSDSVSLMGVPEPEVSSRGSDSRRILRELGFRVVLVSLKSSKPLAEDEEEDEDDDEDDSLSASALDRLEAFFGDLVSANAVIRGKSSLLSSDDGGDFTFVVTLTLLPPDRRAML